MAQPAEDATIVQPEEEPQPVTQPAEDEFVVDDEEPTAEDDIIYFNEDTPQQPTNAKPDNRKESFELEDEYYELDGF